MNLNQDSIVVDQELQATEVQIIGNLEWQRLLLPNNKTEVTSHLIQFRLEFDNSY